MIISASDIDELLSTNKLVRQSKDLIAPLILPEFREVYNVRPDAAWVESEVAKRMAKPQWIPTKIGFSNLPKCPKLMSAILLNELPSPVVIPGDKPALRLPTAGDYAAVRGEFVHNAFARAASDSGLVKYVNGKPAIELKMIYGNIPEERYRWIVELNLTGRIDIFGWNGELWEIKTKDAKGLHFIQQELASFYIQSQFNGYAAGASHVRVIVINRDGDYFAPMEFTASVDEDFIHRFEPVIKHINASVAEGKFATPAPSKKRCMFCPLQEFCDDKVG